MWKKAIIAAISALAIGPAMASDGNVLATALAPAGCVSGSRVSDDVEHLSARLASLEQRVDQMSQPAPRAGEEQRAASAERQAEFLKHVWND